MQKFCLKHQFQSLIGQLQIECAVWTLDDILEVSIPYRLATNMELFLLRLIKIKVSIPYRLATNWRADTLPLSHFRWFQSLIGQLQMSVMCGRQMIFWKFQSLIGQLQIITKQCLQASQYCVSIPYRLATNTWGTTVGGTTTEFQSLIGQLQITSSQNDTTP